jgi:hypothetical protein
LTMQHPTSSRESLTAHRHLVMQHPTALRESLTANDQWSVALALKSNYSASSDGGSSSSRRSCQSDQQSSCERPSREKYAEHSCPGFFFLPNFLKFPERPTVRIEYFVLVALGRFPREFSRPTTHLAPNSSASPDERILTITALNSDAVPIRMRGPRRTEASRSARGIETEWMTHEQRRNETEPE